MVKASHLTDKEAIAEAIAEAERKTCTELVLVVAPASDAYQSTMLLYGLIAAAQSALVYGQQKSLFSFLSCLRFKLQLWACLPLFRDCGIRACALSPNASCITVLAHSCR